MRIILHIGSHKTGTSSIQKALWRHRSYLSDHGVLYPLIRNMKRHSILSVPFHRTKVPREFWRHFGQDKAQVDEIAYGFWREIQTAVAQEKPDILVLSGEQFFSADAVGDAREFLAGVFPGAEVKVICYLRHPLSFYVSACQQVIKASGRLPRPRARNWPATLRKWADVGDLVIREFSPDTLTQGDVVRDFLVHTLGEDLSEPIFNNRSLQRENETLSAESMIILQKFRKHAFPGEDNVINRETSRLKQVLQALEGKRPAGLKLSRPKLKSEIRRDVLASSAADIQGLEKEFGFRFSDDTLYSGESLGLGTCGSQRKLLGTYSDLEGVLEFEERSLQAMYALALLGCMRH